MATSSDLRRAALDVLAAYLKTRLPMLSNHVYVGAQDVEHRTEHSSLVLLPARIELQPFDECVVYGDSDDETWVPASTPSAPAVSPHGIAGTTTHQYKIVARDVFGTSVASASGQTTTGNATLSVANFNRVTWSAATNETAGYDVYRVLGGATTGRIATVAHGVLTLDDTGLAGNAATAPTARVSAGDLVYDVGEWVGNAELRVVSRSRVEREKIEAAVQQAFLQDPRARGVYVSTVPTVQFETPSGTVVTTYTASCAFAIDGDGFRDEMVWEKSRFSFCDVTVSFPALLYVANATSIEQLVLELTQDFSSSTPSDLEQFQIESDGTTTEL